MDSKMLPDDLEEQLAEMSTMPKKLQELTMNSLRNENHIFDDKRRLDQVLARVQSLEKAQQE